MDLTLWHYRCELVRVVDGDTIDLDVDLGFYMTARIRVRLLDIDTPEMRGAERPDGLKAKEFVEEWFRQAEDLVVQTRKTGKYGRWLADIWRTTPATNWDVDGDVTRSLVNDLKLAGFDWTD